MSESRPDNDSGGDAPRPEPDTELTRCVGSIALTGHDADGAGASAVADELYRGHDLESDASGTVMKTGIVSERVVKVSPGTVIIEVTRTDGRTIKYNVPRHPLIDPSWEEAKQPRSA